MIDINLEHRSIDSLAIQDQSVSTVGMIIKE